MDDEQQDYMWWLAPVLLALAVLGILVVAWRIFVACPSGTDPARLAGDLRGVLIGTAPTQWDAALAALAERHSVDAACLRRAFRAYVVSVTPGAC